MGRTEKTSSRGRSWVSLVVPLIGVLWGSEWGCGGIVQDSRHSPDGGAARSGTGGAELIPAGPTPMAFPCGNALIDPGEQCDGPAIPQGARTCAEVTMGRRPNGVVSCSPDCTLDLSGCYQNLGAGGVPTGTGGRPMFATGGAPIGGMMGLGGSAGAPTPPPLPANDCYASGGVPDPTSSENCSRGVDATSACINKRRTVSCADKCGCSVCPSIYDHCQTDGACFWLFACAEQAACYSTAACESQCPSLVQMAGGINTPSAALLDSVLACLSSNNCPLRCN